MGSFKLKKGKKKTNKTLPSVLQRTKRINPLGSRAVPTQD